MTTLLEKFSNVPLIQFYVQFYFFILFKDLPNKFYRDSQTFHSILRRFSKTTRCPAVFIVSDTYSTEINVQSLFPKDVVASLGIHQIR